MTISEEDYINTQIERLELLRGKLHSLKLEQERITRYANSINKEIEDTRTSITLKAEAIERLKNY